MPEWLLIALGIVWLLIGVFFVLILYQIWRVFKTFEHSINEILSEVKKVIQEAGKIVETVERNFSRADSVIEGIESNIKKVFDTVVNTVNTIKIVPWKTLGSYIKSLFTKKKKGKR